MRQLMLLRHAKSDWDQMDLDDIDRPLSPRGRLAAPIVGRYINRKGARPDLILCSSAVRARQTWELIAAEWDHAENADLPRLEMRASLYLASPAELLSILRRIDDEVATLMIIGHNPGMAQLAGRLAARGDQKDLKNMKKKFPTAALATIKFPSESWSSIKADDGTLSAFVRPKDLM